MPLRRRPLRRAAVVGGAVAIGHHAGKKSGQRQAEEAQYAQEEQYAEPEPASAPMAEPAAGGEGIADQLAKLKSLLDSGVLTQAEFEAAKQAVIQGG